MSATHGLLDRLVRRRRASAGSRLGPPNGAAPAEPAAAHAATVRPATAAQPQGLRERSRIRRRTRFLRRLSELQLRDIGGFMLELHRLGQDRPELVRSKLEAAAKTDLELRALERSLGQRHPLTAVRQPGIGGACAACGTVHGSPDRYCSWCGRTL